MLAVLGVLLTFVFTVSAAVFVAHAAVGSELSRLAALLGSTPACWVSLLLLALAGRLVALSARTLVKELVDAEAGLHVVTLRHSAELEGMIMTLRRKLRAGRARWQELAQVDCAPGAPGAASPGLLVSALDAGIAWLDPAQDPRAMLRWRHLARAVEVANLRSTLAPASKEEHFTHGPHRGDSVADLTAMLLAGEVLPAEITPLVVVRFERALWVVSGNRRLRALQDFRCRAGVEVHVRCLMHDLDCGRSAVPAGLVAKFVEAAASAVRSASNP